ncbi:MAG: HNH endonuclease [Pseudobdellovibrionaceae bacterium]|nr:HNH endonuclease [Bdellovibrionales bacterium]USN46587.1 MAG: HNH endonuclease [Pseudobdellovibrionaceae bacterium]
MKLSLIAIAFQFILLSSSWSFPLKPNPEITPGDICSKADPDYERLRYSQKIAYCRRNVSTSVKTKIYQTYDVNLKCRHNFTIDHFIPLSIGGNNSDENLWPEHKAIKELRLQLEQEVFEAVREGRMTQDEAIDIIIEEKMNPPVAYTLMMAGCPKRLP